LLRLRDRILRLIFTGLLFALLLCSYSAYISIQSQHALRRIPAKLARGSQNVRLTRVNSRRGEPGDNNAKAATPGMPAPAAPVVTPADSQSLASRGLAVPVLGAGERDIKDTFNEARGTNRHEATDIIAPRGATVVAVGDGIVKKLFTSRLGGLTIYEFDPSGTYCYYYAHLDRYAAGVKEGLSVQRGDRIGYVGTTGDAVTPHLHFAIFKLGPDKRWWQGTAIDPYSILIASLSRK